MLKFIIHFSFNTAHSQYQGTGCKVPAIPHTILLTALTLYAHCFSNTDSPDVDCTPEQIYEVVFSSTIMTAFQSIIRNKRQTLGLAGMNPQTFLDRYFSLTNNQVLSGSEWSGKTYDALWSIALGLNQTINDLRGTGNNMLLHIICKWL